MAFALHEGMDVVVMATMTREGVAGFVMGNVAERVLRRFACSVLAVKPDEWARRAGARSPGR
jgi:nucleotide-binding universal stress UspA family protein